MIDAARHGDRAAFAHIHRDLAPMVHGILLARVAPHDADDLLQEVFLHAMRKIRTLRDPHAIGPWLAAIARNLANAHGRARRPADQLPEHLPDGSASTSNGTALHEAHRILGVIRTLPDAYRETLVLRLVEGLTGPQIARCTGLTPGSVRINLHRGMKLLRSTLGLDEEAETEP